MSAGNTRLAIGRIALAAIVAAASAWIALEAHRLAQGPAIPTLPTVTAAVQGDRFRSDLYALPNDPQLGLVEIPAGEFVMGSDPTIDRQAFANERWSSSSYQGRLNLPSYYIGRFEVTVAQYRAFAAATHYPVDFAALAAPEDFPIARVSWADAVTYTQWLTKTLATATGTPEWLRKRLSEGWRFTLPNEAQWEKAARGTDGRIFPWGNFVSREFANFAAPALREVGHFPCPSCPFGLSDMSGNVWELTRSPYQPYPFAAESQRGSPGADSLYVMRGGSYTDAEHTVRTATRGGVDPGARREFIGFRVVLTRD